MTETYWAQLPPEQLVRELAKKRDAWFEHVKLGKLGRWRLALREYYAGDETGGQVGVEGEAEEFTTMKVNHLHSLGEHLVTAIAGQPPTFQPQAMNNDSESTANVTVAKGLLDQAVAHQGLEPASIDATRRAWVLNEAFGSPVWDEDLGEDAVPDTAAGKVLKAGEVRYRILSPVDVVRDFTRSEHAGRQWTIVRIEANRWDLAARYPDQADAIISLPSVIDENTDRPRLANWRDEREAGKDTVALWEFYHEKTPALPTGRETCFVGDEIVLKDGPLRYKEIPCYRLAPEDKIGEESGYSQSADLLAPQHVVNATYSNTLSAINTLGNPVLWQKPGETSVENLEAFSIIKCNEKPEALELLNLPPEVLAFGKDLIAQMEIISGVNAVRRGNIDATGKLSGAAYALIDAKFLEAAAGLIKSYRLWMSQMATATVELYKRFATVPHVTRIVGKSNRVQAKTFTGADLSKISRVEVELANPVTRTLSGRMQIADTLLEKMMIKTPEQYMAVLTTGRLEPVTEGPAKEYDNIKAENEVLADGVKPTIWIFDNHPLHINEHSGVMSSPEARQDQKIAQATLSHIAEHLTNWMQAPPDGLIARGIPLHPSMSMAMPGAPGATDSTKPPQSGEPSSSEPPGASPQPNLPSPPKNPQTGEPAPMPPSSMVQ
jgi:hypothetical protein